MRPHAVTPAPGTHLQPISVVTTGLVPVVHVSQKQSRPASRGEPLRPRLFLVGIEKRGGGDHADELGPVAAIVRSAPGLGQGLDL